jgi:hypothetical protein
MVLVDMVSWPNRSPTLWFVPWIAAWVCAAYPAP